MTMMDRVRRDLTDVVDDLIRVDMVLTYLHSMDSDSVQKMKDEAKASGDTDLYNDLLGATLPLKNPLHTVKSCRDTLRMLLYDINREAGVLPDLLRGDTGK